MPTILMFTLVSSGIHAVDVGWAIDSSASTLSYTVSGKVVWDGTFTLQANIAKTGASYVTTTYNSIANTTTVTLIPNGLYLTENSNGSMRATTILVAGTNYSLASFPYIQYVKNNVTTDIKDVILLQGDTAQTVWSCNLSHSNPLPAVPNTSYLLHKRVGNTTTYAYYFDAVTFKGMTSGATLNYTYYFLSSEGHKYGENGGIVAVGNDGTASIGDIYTVMCDWDTEVEDFDYTNYTLYLTVYTTKSSVSSDILHFTTKVTGGTTSGTNCYLTPVAALKLDTPTSVQDVLSDHLCGVDFYCANTNSVAVTIVIDDWSVENSSGTFGPGDEDDWFENSTFNKAANESSSIFLNLYNSTTYSTSTITDYSITFHFEADGYTKSDSVTVSY